MPDVRVTAGADGRLSRVWWLGLPALAGCGSLPRFVVLRCSAAWLLRQAGRPDLCSRHQHGSAGHSSWCVFRVTQPCQISQMCPQIASGRWTGGSRRHSRPLRRVTDGRCIDVAGAGPCHVACFCQLASQWLKRHLSHAGPETVLS